MKLDIREIGCHASHWIGMLWGQYNEEGLLDIGAITWVAKDKVQMDLIGHGHCNVVT
jgi:hypothetical protein